MKSPHPGGPTHSSHPPSYHTLNCMTHSMQHVHHTLHTHFSVLTTHPTPTHSPHTPSPYTHHTPNPHTLNTIPTHSQHTQSPHTHNTPHPTHSPILSFSNQLFSDLRHCDSDIEVHLQSHKIYHRLSSPVPADTPTDTPLTHPTDTHPLTHPLTHPVTLKDILFHLFPHPGK